MMILTVFSQFLLNLVFIFAGPLKKIVLDVITDN